MTLETLQIIWFCIIILLLTVYAVLDGFDLGAGILSLFLKKEERPHVLNAIGPFWDGNEVWLLTAGGALFAAFPGTYATVFSGFYAAMIAVVLSLGLRAVSIEFRGKIDNAMWQKIFDITFFLGSLCPSFLFGVAIGNVLGGIPLNETMDYTGSFVELLNPYSLLCGILTLTMFATQGAAFLAKKMDGGLAKKMAVWTKISSVIFLVTFIAVMAFSFKQRPHLFNNFNAHLSLCLVPLVTLVFIVLSGKGFIFSSASIGGLGAIFGLALFPNTAFFQLTIFNSSASLLTLKSMFYIALIGMPFVLGYTIWIYYTFKEKIDSSKTQPSSY